jgi:TetR/AcrR family transcriptional regulator, tetracycline repressor protein
MSEHVVSARRIEAARRLVEQNELRRVDEGLRQLRALLHPERKGSDRPGALLLEAHLKEHLRCADGRGAPGEATQLGKVDHEVARGHLAREAVVLGHVSDQAANLRRAAGGVEAEHLDPSTVGVEQAEDRSDEGRLSGAVGAKEPGRHRVDVDRHGVERDDRAEALGQLVDSDCRAGSGWRHPCNGRTSLRPLGCTVRYRPGMPGKERRGKIREPLSEGRIVEAALRRIDDEGLESLSMRRLGADLSVEEMLDAVVGIMVRDIRAPGIEIESWRERLLETARSFRAVATAHPNAFPLVMARPVGAYLSGRTVAEASVATLMHAGFDQLVAIRAFRAIARYVIGFCMAEAAGPREETAIPPGLDADGSLIWGLMADLVESSDDALFEYGMSLILTGLEVSLREGARSA